jgi:hypothetical protein
MANHGSREYPLHPLGIYIVTQTSRITWWSQSGASTVKKSYDNNSLREDLFFIGMCFLWEKSVPDSFIYNLSECNGDVLVNKEVTIYFAGLQLRVCNLEWNRDTSELKYKLRDTTWIL